MLCIAFAIFTILWVFVITMFNYHHHALLLLKMELKESNNSPRAAYSYDINHAHPIRQRTVLHNVSRSKALQNVFPHIASSLKRIQASQRSRAILSIYPICLYNVISSQTPSRPYKICSRQRQTVDCTGFCLYISLTFCV
jgi:hypothetical protein